MTRLLRLGLMAVLALAVPFSAGLLFLGVCLYWEHPRDAAVAKPEPQVIALANLLARGAGDNAHVTVTDFSAGPDPVIRYQTSDGVDHTFLIARPRGPAPPGDGSFLLIQVPTALSAGDAAALAARPTLTGLYSTGAN